MEGFTEGRWLWNVWYGGWGRRQREEEAMEGVGVAWVGYGPCPRRGIWTGQGESWRIQGFGNGADARVDGATATAAATEEATLTLKSAPALVGRPESKPVAGRRAGNRREAWGRSEVTMSTRGSMASPAADAVRRRIAPMAARRSVRTRRGSKNGMLGRNTTNSGTADPAAESV